MAVSGSKETATYIIEEKGEGTEWEVGTEGRRPMVMQNDPVSIRQIGS
jgi:hypothetical protein